MCILNIYSAFYALFLTFDVKSGYVTKAKLTVIVDSTKLNTIFTDKTKVPILGLKHFPFGVLSQFTISVYKV